MSWEIERRFLIRVDPRSWDEWDPGMSLRQGYLVAGPTAVRVRFGEGRGPVLTCKQGSGVRRREVECVVSEEMAEALWSAADDRVIRKTRYRVGAWEVDRFEGPLSGLELLELELESETDAMPSPPLGISILREVTNDNLFTSSALASMTSTEQQRWVQDTYRDAEP